MNLILLGAPGAGKGTMAAVIAKKYDIPTVSTGNIIRAALKSGSEMGKKAKEYTDKGALVPDSIVIDIIKERLAEKDCKNGFILDGFPRTIVQAKALDDMGVKIDAALLLDASDELIIERMSGRRVCEKCGASYHIVTIKPKRENVCDVCGGALVTRDDDKPETVKSRLAVYHEQSEPLVDYYKAQNKLLKAEVDNNYEHTAKVVIDTLSEI
ncbi:MAG: adenylate kinase [Clostridia bacterium]|nr:adenylate kinase [Clostridia bacterium]